MLEMKAIAEELVHLVKTLRLEEHAISQFFKDLEVYQKENNDEFKCYFPNFTRENLAVEVIRLTYCLQMQENALDSINVCLGIFYKKIYLAKCTVQFNNAGKIIDSSFYVISDMIRGKELLNG